MKNIMINDIINTNSHISIQLSDHTYNSEIGFVIYKLNNKNVLKY